MIYVDFSAGNKDYKLRLNTRNVVALEKMLGASPLSIFSRGDDSIPTITEMVSILFCSLQQLNHGITLNDAYDIFDNYLADGHSAIDFISVVLDVYKVSGLIGGNEAASEKN